MERVSIPVTEMLERLEAELTALPAGATKHDLRPGFDVMAHWIRGLDAASKARVLTELPYWLKQDHPWHSRAAMEIALRLQDRALLADAIGVARERGIRELAEGEDYPPSLIFQLDLLSTISRWQGDPGKESKAYLTELRRAAQTARSYSQRLVAIRGWLTECALSTDGTRRRCLGEAMRTLRKWNSERIASSALSLLHVYFASTAKGVADLRAVLTPDEFAIACPDPIKITG